MMNSMWIHLTFLIKWINFSKKCNLPKLNGKWLENLNCLLIINEAESVINNLCTKKTPRPDDFSREFFQTFKEEFNTILHKFFRKIRKEGLLPNSFYKVNVTLLPKPDNTRKENYRSISLMNINAKIL